jgi:glutathione S-transferase
MPNIVLHQWEMSPFCNKVRRCLRQKGLAFEVKDYNGLLARNAAKLSHAGTLPVIDYDGERVADSVSIARFLDRKHPEEPLYPTDAEELARARFWEDWAGASLYYFEIYYRMLDPDALEKALDLIGKGRPGYERALLKVVFKQRYPKKLHSQGLGRFTLAEVDEKFDEHLDGLEAILAKRDFLVNGKPTIADISVASQLDEIARTNTRKADALDRPKVRAWMARLPPDA